MFDIFVTGARVATSDEVAEALLEYLRVLSEQDRTELVSFPALLDGQPGQAWVTLGKGVPLLAVKSEPELGLSLEGEEFAAWSIRRRAAAAAARVSDLDWNDVP
ncbi:hypothetical protein ACTU3I_07965 [Microbacterium sp. RD1]|uniref:hypothetical protein n=1 Tax=Microbacterium sp. RD1 TaxID=3457313 RepID=UPI003FA5E6C6